MILFPHCKINLGLLIGERRSDGYHHLKTLFYPVPVTDGLEMVADAAGAGCSLQLTGRPLPGGPNLVSKAYDLLKELHPGMPGVKAHLHKVLPTGAGLGGGSANGAFALQLLNRLFSLGHTGEELEALSLRLGSDCPFFLRSGPVLAEGRGEIMQPFPLLLKGWWLLLVHPGIHVSTAWAFSQLEEDRTQPPLEEILSGGPSSWRGMLPNHFEAPVFRAHPPIAAVQHRLYEAGAAYAAMSGSGSSVFGLFREQPQLHFPPEYWVRSLLL